MCTTRFSAIPVSVVVNIRVNYVLVSALVVFAITNDDKWRT